MVQLEDRPAGDLPKLSTYDRSFLQPSSTKGLPPSQILLRGVNLSGSAKFPTFTYDPSNPIVKPENTRSERDKQREYALGLRSDLEVEDEGKDGGRDGWFVGRPLLEEGSDVHFRRLRGWGFNVLRWIIPWEALEHAGPGKYDEAYIDYTIRMLRKAKSHGFRVFISPHQDVFSRYFSGTGAPYWAIEATGICPERVHQTGAALVHRDWKSQHFGEGSSSPAQNSLVNGIKDEEEGQEEWPDMIWNTNLHRLALRHCFTLFYASEMFAPKLKMDGRPVGEFLRGCMNGAFGYLAKRIRDSGDLLDTCLIGWDSLNEPHEGLIGIPDLTQLPPSQAFKKGPSPTPLQSLQLATGQTVKDIAVHDFGSLGVKEKGSITISPPGGEGLWLTGEEMRRAEEKWGWKYDADWVGEMSVEENEGEGTRGKGCPWAMHGVWDPKTNEVGNRGYFGKNPKTGEEWDFIQEFWRPHYMSLLNTIRQFHPEAISFINPPIFASPPDMSHEDLGGRAVLSAHFYDGLTMLGKRRHLFNADAVGIQRGKKNTLQALKLGDRSIRSGLRDQLEELKADAHDHGSLAHKQPHDEPNTEYPALIGELGVPFDMKKTKLMGLAKGPTEWGDYVESSKAMDQLLNACDGHNALSYTLWCYEPLNTHLYGDGWQGENMSLFTYAETLGDDDLLASNPPDLKTLVKLGSRGIESWCRPYPVEVDGRIKEFEFDMSSGSFSLEIETPVLSSPPTAATSMGCTKIFLPYVHYLYSPLSTSTASSNGVMEDGVVVGDPEDGETEWEAGKGQGKTAVHIERISEDTTLELRGQYGFWRYPLDREKRTLNLKIRPVR